MPKTHALAEVFLIALRSLPEEEHDAVLAAIFEDQNFRETLQDLSIFEQRRNEPSEPFEHYLSKRKNKS